MSIATLATLGLPFLPLSAANSACSGPITDITSNPSFTCTVGDKLYSNFSGFDELVGGTYSIIEVNPLRQDMVFAFSTTEDFETDFRIKVLPPSPNLIESVTIIPPTDPSLVNLLVSATSNPGFPTAPFVDLTLDVTFDTGTATSLKFEIRQTPAPLPLLSAGAALGFSRKLRNRIKSCS